jgi:DNA-binding NarL/FixJ family response regulator
MTLGYPDNRTTRYHSQERKHALLTAVWRGESLAEACRTVMVNDSTVTRWCQADGTFRIELARARKAPRKLTERDRAALRMIAEGYTNRMIGNALGLSMRAAADLVTSLMRRRNVNSRAQLAVEAVRVGAITVEVQA